MIQEKEEIIITNEEILDRIRLAEELYLQDRPIQLDTSDVEKFSTFREFLMWLMVNGTQNYDSIYVDDKERQCYKKKYRSTRDLFNLCRFYWPELTLYTLLQDLMFLQRDPKSKVESLRCNDIQRRVWYYQIYGHIMPAKTFEETYMSYDVQNKHFTTETDGISYNHLKQLYEYNNSEEEITTKASTKFAEC